MGFVYGQDYTSKDAINRWCDEGIELNWRKAEMIFIKELKWNNNEKNVIKLNQ